MRDWNNSTRIELHLIDKEVIRLVSNPISIFSFSDSLLHAEHTQSRHEDAAGRTDRTGRLHFRTYQR